jgi:hypothetical protein
MTYTKLTADQMMRAASGSRGSASFRTTKV